MCSMRVGASRALWAAALLLLLMAVPAVATAQSVVTGASRVQQSDVTGPNVSSLMLFEMGTTRTFACEVAWSVRVTAEALTAELAAGALQARSMTASRPLSPDAYRRVLALVSGAGSRAARDSVTSLLTADRRNLRGAARDLTQALRGLLHTAGAMDPARPGSRAASGLAAAVHEFNQFVDGTDAAWITTAPDDFIIIETLLSRLVVAALENEGRTADAASRRGEYGLACAPAPVAAMPAPPQPPPASPAAERAIEVCVLEGNRFQYVPAVLLPLTGDTLAVQLGLRVPFHLVHPDTGYAGELPWVLTGEPIRLGSATYVPYGAVGQAGNVDEMVPAGEYRGVTLFTRKGADTPAKVVFLPAAAPCFVQPYQLMEDVRKKQRPD